MKKRILALLLTVLMVTALLPFGASAAGEKLIALTFDDGPSQYTSQLLDRGQEFLPVRQLADRLRLRGPYLPGYPERKS